MTCTETTSAQNQPPMVVGSENCLASDPGSVRNRLAEKHAGCHCFVDTRCQLALSFQKAREYWNANPHDKTNAPNEVHQNIENWLVSKNLLHGPIIAVNENNPSVHSLPEASLRPSPQKRRSLNIPNLRPVRRRHISLPNILTRKPEYRSLLPAPMHGQTTPSQYQQSSENEYVSPPTSPKRLWRALSFSFKVPGHKVSLSTTLSNDTMSELAREDEAGQAAYREITTSICEDERMVPEFVEELIAHPVSYPSAISPDPEPSPSLAYEFPSNTPPGPSLIGDQWMTSHKDLRPFCRP